MRPELTRAARCEQCQAEERASNCELPLLPSSPPPCLEPRTASSLGPAESSSFSGPSPLESQVRPPESRLARRWDLGLGSLFRCPPTPPAAPGGPEDPPTLPSSPGFPCLVNPNVTTGAEPCPGAPGGAPEGLCREDTAAGHQGCLVVHACPFLALRAEPKKKKKPHTKQHQEAEDCDYPDCWSVVPRAKDFEDHMALGSGYPYSPGLWVRSTER